MDFFSIVKVIFLLLFILGIIYGTLYLLKKYLYVTDKKGTKLIKIKVLSTQMILPKKFIQVVQVHDKILVLGISEHSITLLKEFEDFSDTLTDTENNKLEFKDNFLDILKKNLGMR
jgi:flagellar protein FliO/FliZ